MSEPKETQESSVTEPTRTKRIVHFILQKKIAIPLMVVTLLVAAPFLYRSCRINQLPDIDHPFDYKAFLDFEVPDEENAYVEYRLAGNKLVPYKGDSKILEKALREGWSKTPQNVKDWLNDNRKALEIWKKGTQKPDAQYQRMKDMTLATFLPAVEDAREHARLAVLETNRLIQAGELQKAWEWNHALFRYSRHLGKRGTDIELLNGIAILGVHDFSFVNWMKNPEVDAALLRNAMKNMESAHRMSSPAIEVLKAEYVFAMQICDFEYVRALHDMRSTMFGEESQFSEWYLYFRGEPELSRIVTKHIMANWFEEIEKKTWDRKTTIPGSFKLFDLDHTLANAKHFDPLRVQKVASTVEIALKSRESLDFWIASDKTRYQNLRIAFAAEIYLRENGSYPKKLEELKPILGEIPYDPLHTTARRDLQYRKEIDGYIVWSVGDDGIDNGGKIGNEEKAGPDVGFRITKKK